MTPINFDTLPDEKPISLPNPGTYYATIEKAEMKQPKDQSKPDYLNMQYNLKTPEGKDAGKIWDILSESEHSLIRYKISRFLNALQLDFQGNTFELKDLCKIVLNKQFIVDVTQKEDDYGKKAEVDLFSNEVYYPLSEANKVFDNGNVSEEDIPFNIEAEDAEDAPPSQTPDEEDF